MQILSPDRIAERVGFVIPKWIGDGPHEDRQGVPFKGFPVMGSLYNHGYEVVHFDQELDQYHTDRLAEFRESLRGVRLVFLWANELWPLVQLQSMADLLPRIRSWYPDILFAAGGDLFAVPPASMLRPEVGVDYFLQGTGEHTAPELLKALDGRTKLEEIPGLVWMDDGRHRATPPLAIDHLDPRNNEVPYRKLDLTEYVQRGGWIGNDQGTLYVGSAQGCGRGCAYCWWWDVKPSLMEADYLVDLVEYLRDRYGVHQFQFAEPDFFKSRKRTLELAELWRRRLPDCGYFALISVKDGVRFSEEEWDHLVAGGCGKLEIGTESGSPAMLEAIGKKHLPEEASLLNRMLMQRRVPTMHNFILGFVDETEEDRTLSLQLMEELHAQDPRLVTLVVRLYMAVPGTPMGDRAIEMDPNYPKTLGEFAGYRPQYADIEARALPWLDADTEREVKWITQFLLPLATSRAVFPGAWRRLLFRGLQRAAWYRLRHRRLEARLEERLYRRFLGHELTQTYRP